MPDRSRRSGSVRTHPEAVSYTHLDVYKRQSGYSALDAVPIRSPDPPVWANDGRGIGKYKEDAATIPANATAKSLFFTLNPPDKLFISFIILSYFYDYNLFIYYIFYHFFVTYKLHK